MADEKYIYLNLQQQVGKNKADIEELRTVKFNLERAGVRVVGEEASVSDLPDPTTYGGELGDAYLIGESAPYDMYVFTQPSVGETNFKWFNLGAFPAQGPQGEQGPKGPEGPQGDASKWRFGSVNPSILETDKEHDGYINTTSGMIFTFDGERWIPVGSIRGPQGTQGPQGPKGETGDTGPQGVQGPVGPAGMTIEVIGVVATVGSLPDPDSTQRNAGYIVDDGVNQDLYIIVYDEGDDQLEWYNAGPFAGTPGEAAGFGVIGATVTIVSSTTPASVDVSTSGPDNAKNISFSFKIPQETTLENSDSAVPSSSKGYTQEVIQKRTLYRVYKSLTELGLSTPSTIAQILAAMNSGSDNKMLVITNDTGSQKVTDTPQAIGQLTVLVGSVAQNGEVRFVDQSYNVYIFGGMDGVTPLWHRLITTKDEEALGVPAGGTTGQILRKQSDDDFDTDWENVPNAPNGVAAGGTTGQILSKKTDSNYDTEWANAPRGIPDGGNSGQVLGKASGADGDVTWVSQPVGMTSGGTTGQILQKKSNSNYDTEWANAPAGLPAGGSTGQMLQKSSGTDYAVEWANKPAGLPAGGTTGQVLQKSSGTDYDVEWATPSGGGGGTMIFGENLLINPSFISGQRVNQRNFPTTLQTLTAAGYTTDRWYATNGTKLQINVCLHLYDGAIKQYIDSVVRPSKYFICGVRVNTVDYNEVPEIKLYAKSTGTYSQLTPVNNTPIEIALGTYDKQVVNVYEIPVGSLEYYFELSKTGNTSNYAEITETFIYQASEVDLTQIGNTRFPVHVNFATELEKCKYYFENTGSYVTSVVSNINSTNTFINVRLAPKRVSPTMTYSGISLRSYQLDGTFAKIEPTIASIIGYKAGGCSLSIENTQIGTKIIVGLLILNYLRADAEIYP